MTPSDFDFADAEFNPDDAVPDDMLALDDLQPDMTISADLATGPQIAAEVRLPTRSVPDTAMLVEDQLLEMLENNDRDLLLTMTGEKPSLLGQHEPGALGHFASDYAIAVEYNPAIKWYAKLCAMSAPEQFCVQQGTLSLAMPPKKFQKVLQPFLGDFDETHVEDSPIVAVVRNLAQAMGVKLLEQGKATVARTQKRSTAAREESDLDLAAVDFSDNQWVDESITADLGIDEDVFGEAVDLTDSGTPLTTASRFKLSLADLSNKAIMEHCLSNYDCSNINAVSEELLDQGLEPARVNEITGMLRYRTAHSKTARVQPSGNRGAGSIDFPFGL